MPDTPKANREAARIRARNGNAWRDGEQFEGVRDPYRGDVVAHAPVSSAQDLDDALAAAFAAKDAMAAMPGHERAALLRRAADDIVARSEAIGRSIAARR